MKTGRQGTAVTDSNQCLVGRGRRDFDASGLVGEADDARTPSGLLLRLLASLAGLPVQGTLVDDGGLGSSSPVPGALHLLLFRACHVLQALPLRATVGGRDANAARSSYM